MQHKNTLQLFHKLETFGKRLSFSTFNNLNQNVKRKVYWWKRFTNIWILQLWFHLLTLTIPASGRHALRPLATSAPSTASPATTSPAQGVDFNTDQRWFVLGIDTSFHVNPLLMNTCLLKEREQKKQWRDQFNKSCRFCSPLWYALGWPSTGVSASWEGAFSACSCIPRHSTGRTIKSRTSEGNW